MPAMSAISGEIWAAVIVMNVSCCGLAQHHAVASSTLAICKFRSSLRYQMMTVTLRWPRAARPSKGDGPYGATSAVTLRGSARFARLAPQRLCSFSSGLPLFFVPEHGVEDGHDLPSDGDEGHHFRLTLSEQALVEGTQHWIAADGGKRRQEDGRTGSWAAAANHALAFPLAGSARERRNPNKACDLAAIETTELGHIGEDAAGDCVADAREGDQQVLFFAPERRAAHHRVDIAIDDRQLLLERGDVTREALAHAYRAGALLALALRHHHFDELRATANQLSQQTRRLVGQLARLRFHRLGKMGDHRRIDGIRLCPPANRLREIAHLCRVNYRQRQMGARDRRRHDRLEATGCLHRDQRRRNTTQPLNQLTQAFAIAWNGKSLPAGTHVHVQPVLRYIDANKGRVHLDPSLRNRARLAAQATVPVRWNGGRSPALRHGLQSPRMKRSPVRHRTGQCSRVGNP